MEMKMILAAQFGMMMSKLVLKKLKKPNKLKLLLLYSLQRICLEFGLFQLD